jgi:hypothetical protein
MYYEHFKKALVFISARMYQNCDINQIKPIDLLLMNIIGVKD